MDNYGEDNNRRFESPYNAQLIYMGAMSEIEKAFYNYLISKEKWITITLTTKEEIRCKVKAIISPVAIMVQPKEEKFEQNDNGDRKLVYTYSITYINFSDPHQEFRPSSLT